MNADLSVAPEIAQLAMTVVPLPASSTAPRTAGRMAGELTRLAADPQRWWDLVRFDPDGPARVPVPGTDGAWLLVLPPGVATDCDCGYATLLAGEAAEGTGGTGGTGAAGAARALHPGRVRLHGRGSRHRIRGAGHGYSVSLHWAAGTARSEENQIIYP